MEVISQQSSLERQLSSISGSELRLGLFFWKAAAGALLFIFLIYFLPASSSSAGGRAGGRAGLNERKVFGCACGAFFMRVLEKCPVSVWRECGRTSKWAFRSASPHTDGVLGVVTTSLPRRGITSYQAFSKQKNCQIGIYKYRYLKERDLFSQ